MPKTAPACDSEATAHTPYQTLLGEWYARLHPHVRVAHEAPLLAEGAVDVTHGAHPLTPLFIRAMNLPAAGPSKPVTLVVDIDSSTPGTAPTMTWMRQIGETRLDTRQFARQGHLVEEAGPGAVEFRLRVDEDGSLVYENARCRFLRIPVPDVLSPQVRARVAPASSGWRVSVVVEWRGHPICTYGGLMQPVRTAT